MHIAQNDEHAAPQDGHDGHDGIEARLHVSGVATPILTRVTRQTARGMTVEQMLPFLQLRTQVWDDARQASHIESVSVVVYDGMPRLVLDLAYDDDDSAAVDGSVMAAAEPVRRAHAGVVRPRVRVDQTVPFEHERVAAPVRESKPTQREASQVFTTQGSSNPSTKALVAAELPPEIPGLKLSRMEEELLQPKDLVFHTKVAWQRAQPKLQHAQREAIRLGGIALQKARPMLLRAFAKLHALALRCTRAIGERMRARSAAAAAKAAASAPATTDAA
jgi:hypothetical protein